jgi:hypothetical protein
MFVCINTTCICICICVYACTSLIMFYQTHYKSLARLYVLLIGCAQAYVRTCMAFILYDLTSIKATIAITACSLWGLRLVWVCLHHSSIDPYSQSACFLWGHVFIYRNSDHPLHPAFCIVNSTIICLSCRKKIPLLSVDKFNLSVQINLCSGICAFEVCILFIPYQS